MADDRLPVRIGSKRFEVEVPAISRGPLGEIAESRDNQADPAEQSLTNDGLWKRSGEDWSLGAGQRYQDLRTDRNPSVRERYRYATGIDVFSERRQASLLPQLTQRQSIGASSTGGMWRKGNVLRAIAAQVYYYSDADDPSSWTLGTDSLAGAPVSSQSGAVVGGVWYVADGTQVLDDTNGASTLTSQFSATDTDYLIGGGGRLLGMHDNDLWEFDSDGTKLGGDASGNIFSHRWAGFAWKGGLATDNGIYVFGDDGTESEIFFMVPVDATGELPPPYLAMNSLEQNELVRSMKSFGGVMVIGTTQGVRLCNIASNGTLTPGPLVDHFGSTVDLHFDGQFAYGTCSSPPNADGDGTRTDGGLAIYNIGEWTNTLTPAYAEHLMAGQTCTPIAVERLNDKLCVLLLDGGGNAEIWSENTNRVASGVLRTGGITLGIADKGALSSVEIQCDDLPSGSSFTVSYFDRIGGTETELGILNDAGETEAVFRTDESLVEEEPELEITFTRGATTTADPTLRRWTMRALPVIRRNQELLLPVKLYTTVTDDQDIGSPVRQDPLELWQYLWGLMSNREIIEVELGDELLLGRVEGVYGGPARIEGVGFDEWWSRVRSTNGWLTGTVQVVIHTLNDDGIEL